MPQQDACKHFFNTSKNIWRLHTFLHHFGHPNSPHDDERLSQILITETSCRVKGHPRKARSLVRKWITHNKKNQHALKLSLEQSLLSCLIGTKEVEGEEKIHQYQKIKKVSHYHDRHTPALAFTSPTCGKSTSCEESTDVEKMSEDDDELFDIEEHQENTCVRGPSQDSNDSPPSLSSLFTSKTFESQSMPVTPASPLSPVFAVVPSSLPSVLHLQSDIRVIVEDLKKMERTRQELERTLETKQKLLDRYESLSTMQSLHDSMNSNSSPSPFSSSSPFSRTSGSPPLLYNKDFKFIGDIQTDSTLYLSNYRRDLHIFVLLYGIDSLRVSSLLDPAIQVFNAYATHFQKRPQLEPAFAQFRWYLLMNNFSTECQHEMAGGGEYRRLVEGFFKEVESVCTCG